MMIINYHHACHHHLNDNDDDDDYQLWMSIVFLKVIILKNHKNITLPVKLNNQ